MRRICVLRGNRSLDHSLMELNTICGRLQKLLLRYVRGREGRRGRGGEKGNSHLEQTNEKDLCTERQQKFGPLINGTKHDLWEASKAFIEVC